MVSLRRMSALVAGTSVVMLTLAPISLATDHPLRISAAVEGSGGEAGGLPQRSPKVNAPKNLPANPKPGDTYGKGDTVPVVKVLPRNEPGIQSPVSFFGGTDIWFTYGDCLSLPNSSVDGKGISDTTDGNGQPARVERIYVKTDLYHNDIIVDTDQQLQHNHYHARANVHDGGYACTGPIFHDFLGDSLHSMFDPSTGRQRFRTSDSF